MIYMCCTSLKVVKSILSQCLKLDGCKAVNKSQHLGRLGSQSAHCRSKIGDISSCVSALDETLPSWSKFRLQHDISTSCFWWEKKQIMFFLSFKTNSIEVLNALSTMRPKCVDSAKICSNLSIQSGRNDQWWIKTTSQGTIVGDWQQPLGAQWGRREATSQGTMIDGISKNLSSSYSQHLNVELNRFRCCVSLSRSILR